MKAPGLDLTKLVNRNASSRPVPYFASIRTPDPADLVQPKLIENLEGMLLAHVVRIEDGSSQLFTYWESEEHFRSGRAVLFQRLVAPLVAVQGLVATPMTPAVKWWKSIKLSTLILSAAGILGALEVLGNRYERLFAEPYVLVKPERSKFEVIEGEDFRTTVGLANQLPVAEHRGINVAAYLQDRQGQRYPLKLTESEIPVLSGGVTRDLVIEGKLPSAGEYIFKVDVDAASGLLRWPKAFNASSRIVIWPNTPRGLLRLINASGSQARFAGAIAVGPAAPHGVECALQIRGIPNLQYNDQHSATVEIHVGKLKTAGEKEDLVSQLSWSTGPVEAKKTVTVNLILLGDAATDWVALIKKSTLDCEFRKEKFNVSKS